MDLYGFLTSLSTSFAIFCFLLLIFSFLSWIKSNDAVYHPVKLLLRGKRSLNTTTTGAALPPTAQAPAANTFVPRGYPWYRKAFAWAYEAWTTTEDQIVRQSGIDSAVYLIFLESALRICALTAAFCIPVLIPVAGSDNYYESQKQAHPSFVFSSFDKISAGNVKPGSGRLWCFVLGAYWLTFVTFWILRRTYRHVVDLRASIWYSSNHATPEQFVVLVRDIPPPPPGRSMAQEVDHFFRRLHPYTYESCLVVADIKRANKIWKEMESHWIAYKSAEKSYEKSRRRVRPKRRTKFICGPVVDTMEYHRANIERLARDMEEEEKRMEWEASVYEGGKVGAAFVVFKNRVDTSSAAQAMHGENPNKWGVMPAPEPREVIWENLRMPFKQRSMRDVLVYIVVVITILFYMVPISFVSAMMSLDNLEKWASLGGGGSFFRNLLNKTPIVRSLLQAYLPQVALLVFLFLLPPMLLRLSRAQGIPSRSHAVRAAAGKYFYFIVFNVFLGVTISGTLFTALSSLIREPNSLVSLLSKSIPPQATFFISFVALKFFVGYGLQLCRFGPLLIYHIKHMFVYNFDDDASFPTPPPFKYEVRVPDDMLIITITLCYAIIAPMILPFAAIYFVIGWFVAKYQILNVIVPTYESGGRMWPHMNSRILAALLLSQLTMLGYFSVKKFPYSTLLIPLPITTIVFSYICWKSYYPSLRFSPLAYAATSHVNVVTTEAILNAYKPTCLKWRELIDISILKTHNDHA